MKSWAVEVLVSGETTWASNGMRYHTKEQAEISGRDLMSRWFAVREWRAVESEDEPNADKPTVYGAGHRVRL